MGRDEDGVWSVGWKRPNSPAGMARIHYMMTFLTWLTQEGDASMTRVAAATLPGDDTESLAVDVAFGGRDPQFTVFIDPTDSHLRGFRNGRSLHRISRYTEAHGLLVPSDWTTYAGDQVIGNHSVINVEFLDEFDPSLVAAPEGAVR